MSVQVSTKGVYSMSDVSTFTRIAVEQRAPATESDPLVSTVTHVIPGRTGGSDEETPLLDVNC